MKMMEILPLYFGGIVKFSKEVKTKNKIFNKGERVHIASAILYLYSTGAIPEDSFKLEVRKLNQLSNQELLEFSKTVSPKKNTDHIRKVSKRNGKSSSVISISIDEIFELNVGVKTDLVIQENSNSINILLRNTITQNKIIANQQLLPIDNQMLAFKWLLSRHIDIFKLPKSQGLHRSTWTDKNYQSI